MKVGIAGFSGSGKSTLFHWLTGVAPDPAAAQRGQIGIAKVADERLDWLSAHFKPKKTTPATLEFLDTPGLLLDERRDNPRRLGILRESDGLLIILTGYSDIEVLIEGPNWPRKLPSGCWPCLSWRIRSLFHFSQATTSPWNSAWAW